MKKKKLEQRSCNFEVRAEKTEQGGIITGRPIVYNSRASVGDMFDEIIDSGALNDADLTDVRFLVNHNERMVPLARSRTCNRNSTMHLTVDNEGLSIRVLLDIQNNHEARALYSAVERGDITGMSFKFGVDREEWDDLESDHPTRHIKNISRVVEVSAVTFPAYDTTEITVRDNRTK